MEYEHKGYGIPLGQAVEHHQAKGHNGVVRARPPWQGHGHGNGTHGKQGQHCTEPQSFCLRKCHDHQIAHDKIEQPDEDGNNGKSEIVLEPEHRQQAFLKPGHDFPYFFVF